MFKKILLVTAVIGLVATLLSTNVSADINDPYPDRVEVSGLLSGSTLTLSWSKSDDPTFKRYHIIQSTNDEHPQYLKNQTIWSTDDVDETTHQVDDLKKDEVYYFRVCVNNTGNKSTCSNIVHINQYQMVRNFTVYRDINSDAWYKPYVDDLQSKIILPAYDRTFEPARSITRREFAEWLVSGITDEEDIGSQAPYFCDTTEIDNYINYLYKLGVAEGYEGGSCDSGRLFRPEQTINRAEAVKLLLEVLKVKIDQSKIEYAPNPANSNIAVDVNQKQWFAKYIYWAQKDGVVDTNSNGYFRPGAPLNRAEAAKILSKALIKYY